ncbi:MAG: UvrD-helicase domain-containing protein [Ignavibacteria bacterium]|jgi:DNA helicase-2/ATP-dependent DNA helicase PcrA|nr:UvrD-helicase domain-containing protein [Ignavibacteria bacterium]
MPLDLSILNEEQRQAVEQIEGPSIIIAGAGSGKTRVLTYKIAHLIESGVSPYEILALTFTNKAASEMKERIGKLVEINADKIWMGTFHSIFARILRFDGDKIGFDRNFTIYDSDDSANVVKQIMQNRNMSIENPTPKSIHSEISKQKNKLITPAVYASVAKSPFEKRVEEIYPLYQETLQKNNAMDFDDLLMKPIELFMKNPDVLEKYQERFKFILVDEYQDTNRAQYQIVKMLAQKYQNITIVGDDAQSIYKWRGAEIQNIFDFEEDFSENNVFKLEQNYRSTKKILALADDVIKRNKKQFKKDIWTDNFDGEHITLLETMSDKDEAYKITRYITEEIYKQKYNFKDFVILYRTNAQSRIIEDSLRQNGIPYLIVGGIRFYQRKEIKDIIANLRIVVNPSDNESLLRVLANKEGVGKTSIDKLTRIAEIEGKQLMDVLKNVEDYPEFGGKTKNLLLEVSKFSAKYKYLSEEMSLTELAKSIIDETGLMYKLRLENTIESEERLNNLQELISAIAQYDDNNEGATLEGFLQEVSLVADIDTLDDRKNAVTLMTIHAAKGLEYPVVFITGLEEGLFPSMNSISNLEDLEEERRLFYVAVTRAKTKLYLSFANMRYRFGTPSYQMKSKFIKEISEHIYNEHIKYEGVKIPQAKKSTSSSSFRRDNPAIKYDVAKSTYKKEEYYAQATDDAFSDIKKGVVVNHTTFGKGTVLEVVGKGVDKKAEIYFDDIGLKKIVLKYAKMTVYSNE